MKAGNRLKRIRRSTKRERGRPCPMKISRERAQASSFRSNEDFSRATKCRRCSLDRITVFSRIPRPIRRIGDAIIRMWSSREEREEEGGEKEKRSLESRGWNW